MANKVKSKWDKLDANAQKWAKRLTAIATIVGVLTAGGSYIINQLDNAVATRIEAQTTALQEQVQEIGKERESTAKQTELQLTRLELMMLMETDPDNAVEIEKVAHHYFVDGRGNSYMSSLYNTWCHTHNGDCEIMFK